MPILDASGRAFSTAPVIPGLTRYAYDQLNHLVDIFDTFAPQMTRVPTAIGAVERSRADRWVNGLTGIGTFADKTRHGFFDAVWRIPDQELTNLMNGSDLASKIIEKRPKEMFRRGFDLKANVSGGKAGGRKAKGKAEIDQSAIKDFRDWCTEELLLEDRFKQGMIYGRQYGGTLALLGIDDGRDPAAPLDEDNIRSFGFINVIDRRFCWVNSYYPNPDEPKFGEPETYMVSNGVAAQDYRPQPASKIKKRGWSTMVVHETRVIRFDGVATDMLTRQTLAGWSWSVLQRVYEVLRQFDHGFDSAVYLLSDASQGVYKLKGLLQAISSGNKQILEDRMQVAEEMRSVMRGIMLDADEKSGESFERKATPMTGIPEMLDRLMQRLAAGADMPVQEIFGAGAGGLNAAGEAQAATRKWYDTIQTEAQDQAAPKLGRIFRLAAKAGNSPLKRKDVRWGVEFHPMWEPTDDELAGTRLKKAQASDIYLTHEVIAPEVVALTLKDEYSSIDEDEIEASIKAKKTFDPHKNDPPPAPGTPGGPPLLAGVPGAPGAPRLPGAPGAPRLPGAPGGPAQPGPLPQKTPAPSKSATIQARGLGGEDNSPTMPLPGPPGEQSGALTTAQSRANDRPTARLGQPKRKGDEPTKKGTPRNNGKARMARADRLSTLPAIDAAALAALDALIVTRSDAGAARAVFQQLLSDYPADSLGWVLAAHWTGPVAIPIDDIDTSKRESWKASHDGNLEKHMQMIEEGDSEPAVLVTPPSGKHIIVDGHHRTLAYEALGRPVIGYIAEVHVERGPWDELHSMQKRGTSKGSISVTSWEVANATPQNPKPREGSRAASRSDAIPPTKLPPDFGTVVPAGGSHCANCRFLASSEPATCGNSTFAKWVQVQKNVGTGMPPAPIPAPDGDAARYCCSAWQAPDGALKKDADDERPHTENSPRSPRGAAFVILFDRGGRILTVSRPEPPHEPSLPGGEVENDETAETAALRELLEETGCEVEGGALDIVYKTTSPTDGRDVQIFSGYVKDPAAAKALEPDTRVEWLRPGDLVLQSVLYKKTIQELAKQNLLGTFSPERGDAGGWNEEAHPRVPAGSSGGGP